MNQFFSVAVNAIGPFIFYMTFGYLTVHLFKWTEEGFLKRLNSLVFQCFFPLLMFNNFCTMDFSGGFQGGYILFALAATAILIGILVIVTKPLVPLKSRRSVIIQALFRSNAILFALPLAESVFGEEGKNICSVLLALIVPLYNVVAVIILQTLNEKKTDPLKMVISVLTNPLIMGAIAGLILLLLKVELPSFILKPVKAISDMTTPLALFVLGGTLHFSSLKKNGKVLGLNLAVKLLIVPALILFISSFFQFSSAERFVIFIMFGTPVAVSSYTMAANMGGDENLAGEFVATSTVASLITLFFWILLMQGMGII